METVLPPRRSGFARHADGTSALVPFSVGADSFLAGRPLAFNPYAVGTLSHERFVTGWHAAQNVAEAEAADVAREAAEDAAGDLHA